VLAARDLVLACCTRRFDERLVWKLNVGDPAPMTTGRFLALVLASTGLVFSAQAQDTGFTVTPTWDGISKCNGRPLQGPSPRFAVINAPRGTELLEFNMKDVDAPRSLHGGGSASYQGAADVPSGTFNFIGPCRPGSHVYEWSITARDAAGKSLGTTTSRLKYP
jgi:hypothetical protein